MPNYRVRVLAVLLLVVVASVMRGFGEEQQFQAHNFAITVPETWRPTVIEDQPSVAAAFSTADGKKWVYVIIDDKSKVRNPEMDDRYIREYEAGIVSSHGSKLKWGRPADVAGIKGYERLGERESNGRKITILTRVVLGDGKHYIVDGMLMGGDASEDPEIRAAMESFRFLRTPAKIGRGSGSASFRAGHAQGQLTMWVLAIVAIGYGVVTAMKKRGGGGKPPPLPRV